MFPRKLVEQLHCPFCGSDLAISDVLDEGRLGISFGIAECACYRYPILDGILVVRQIGAHKNSPFDLAVELLERGRRWDAVRAALDQPAATILDRALSVTSRLRVPGSRRLREHRARTKLRPLVDGTLGFEDAAALMRRKSYADYLTHRFANPSFLSAVPLLCLLAEQEESAEGERNRVLDLGCGVGQSSALLRGLNPGIDVISVDIDFTNLFLGRRFLSGEGIYLCADAERLLPFEDDAFRGVFSLDAFHYMASKVATLAEVDRIVEPEGVWVFAHLHNALCENPAAGIPLSPDDYRRLFARTRGKLLPENRILHDFFVAGRLGLSASIEDRELEGAPAVGFIGCRLDEFWRDRSDLDLRLLRMNKYMMPNPIYRHEGEDHETMKKMQWPNPALEKECGLIKDLLPAEISVDPTLLARYQNGQLAREDEPLVREMVRTFLLVPQLFRS